VSRLRPATTALLVTATTALLPLAAQAQELSYEVTPKSGQIELGQSFQIYCDIVVSGAEIASLSPPQTGDLRVVGQSRSEGTQVSIVNGRLSSSRTVRLVLTLEADTAGTHTIGPGKVRAGGKTARSQPVVITVVEPGQQAPAPAARATPPRTSTAPDPGVEAAKLGKLFLALAVDKAEVFLGEQLTVTLTLYSRLDLSDIRTIRLPDFEGVVTEDLITPRRVSPQPTRIGGKRYHAFTLRKVALFPTRSGLLVLPPAEAVVVVGGGFFSQGQLVRRQSEPVEVTVKPLPVEERPRDFEPGNVGRFSLEVSVSKRRISQRDPLTVKVALVGRGNFRGLALPSLGSPADFRVYEPTAFEETRAERDVIVGRKGYEVLLQPQRAGRLSLPVLRFSFFDPEKGRYQIVASDPISIEVSPWSSGQASSLPLAEEPALQLPARPVRMAPRLHPTPQALGRRPLAVSLGALNLGLLGLLVVDRALRRRRRSERGAHRRKLRAAQRALLTAAEAGDADACAGAVERFLSVVLERSAVGLTRDELGALLAERGLNAAAVARSAELLDAIESLRYAPAGSTVGGDLPALARALVAAALESAGAGEVDK